MKIVYLFLTRFFFFDLFLSFFSYRFSKILWILILKTWLAIFMNWSWWDLILIYEFLFCVHFNWNFQHIFIIWIRYFWVCLYKVRRIWKHHRFKIYHQLESTIPCGSNRFNGDLNLKIINLRWRLGLMRIKKTKDFHLVSLD